MSERAETSPPRWLLVSVLAGIVVLVAVVIRYGDVLIPLFGEPERLRAWVDSFGAVGPVVLVVVCAAQVIIAPIPGQVAGFVAGYLYGVILGTAYSMAGLILGTVGGMWLARQLGRPFVLRFVQEERLARWDALTKRWGPATFFVAFLVPGMPDDFLCFVVGLTSLRLGPMVAYAAVGRLPGMVAAAYFGAHSTAVPTWAWVVAVVVGVVVAVALIAKGEALAEGIARRLHR